MMMPDFLHKSRLWSLLILILFICQPGGCVSSSWKQKIGKYTFEEAVKEYGPPDAAIKLKSGVTTYSWYMPTAFGSLDKIILTFSEAGLLVDGNRQFMGNVPPPMGPVFIDRRIY
ncbi:MAG: hypothetical protein LR011_11320 [Verrucomicrobia bacterium]|nr:hypothetical protein [Verrucomicrobiota bacterium]